MLRSRRAKRAMSRPKQLRLRGVYEVLGWCISWREGHRRILELEFCCIFGRAVVLALGML